jgi:hypothetical protein
MTVNRHLAHAAPSAPGFFGGLQKLSPRRAKYMIDKAVSL